MKYSNKIVLKALSILSVRKQQALLEADIRHQEFSLKHPEILEIEKEMSETGVAALKVLDGVDNPVEYIHGLKNKNLLCQQKRAELLTSCGLPLDYLDVKYTCPVCKDTGYTSDGKICSCYENLLKQLSFDELADKTPLKISKFNEFDTSLYDDSETKIRMSQILEYCKQYALNFEPIDYPSLFMYGETGLGKTHLSLAIAGEVIEKGYTVVYGSTQNLLSMLEKEKFGRSEYADGTTEDKLINCDLLILDDLGAEFSTQFTVAAIYNIINSRMANGKPTIINSNVALNELEKMYTSRITSRIIGTYETLKFVGKDMRQILK